MLKRIVAITSVLVTSSTVVFTQHVALPRRASVARRGTAASAPATITQGASDQRALLDTYCVSCHNERLKTGGLVLEHAELEHVSQRAETWEKVARKLRVGAMPPVGRPRPDSAMSAGFIRWLEAELDHWATDHPNPGRPTIHRLNRTEYTNAVRDLLNVEFDSHALLPADDTDKHGFDNNADVLSISPALLERYMSAARKISRLAVGRSLTDPVIATYNVPRTLNQDERISQGTPFGSRGGTAVRHYFPADGEYRVTIRLQRNLYGIIRGLGSTHQLDVRVDGTRIKMFSVGGDARGAPPPLGYGGTIDADPEWERYARAADEGLEVRFSAKAGRRLVAVSFLSNTWVPDDLPQPRQLGFGRDTNEMYDSNPLVDSVTIAGPYQVSGVTETSSRRKIFVCQPTRPAEEETCAKRILSTLAHRAYRRPITDAETAPLLQVYKTRSAQPFDARIEFAVQMILSAPEFLFRIERDPANAAPGSTYLLSDFELASRLSFFLWSSIPDDELLDVATRGTLHDPIVLTRQTRRMLADRRADALVANFADQWLALRNIRNVTPDPDVFQDFDENLREALGQETQLFLASQIREDRSLIELLNANYTFVNERLARHYQIAGVYGERFRKVTFTDQQPRGGLLAQGSLLTVTSYPNRTSPVLRGKWLLENVLSAPPPDPPANVPALKENGANVQPRTVRERLEEHRKNPACAACHAPMDPLGFALENFDAIGGWRTIEAGVPVDSKGALPGGAQFEGLAGLRKLLVTDYKEQFIRAVIERLLSYAVGRNVEYYDLPVVRAIAREAAPDDYHWSAVIVSIVKSLPFRMRRSES